MIFFFCLFNSPAMTGLVDGELRVLDFELRLSFTRNGGEKKNKAGWLNQKSLQERKDLTAGGKKKRKVKVRRAKELTASGSLSNLRFGRADASRSR